MELRAWSRAAAIVVCCLALSLVDAGHLREATALEPGDPAPGFHLFDLAAEHFVDSDSLLAPHRGPILLVFWNTACPDCLADLAATAERTRTDDDCGLRVLGICTDIQRIGDARRFARGMRLEFLNLWDVRGAAASAYGADDESFAALLVTGDDGGLIGEPTIGVAHYGHAEAIDELLEMIWARACAAAEPPSERTDDEP